MRKVFLGALMILALGASAAFAGEELKQGSDIQGLSEAVPHFLVWYCGDDCAYCQRMAPIVAQFEQEHPDIPVYKVMVEQSSFSRTLNLIHTPTWLVYVNGQLVRRWEGVVNQPQFEQNVLSSAVLTGELCEVPAS